MIGGVMMSCRDRDTVMSLPYPIWARVRYGLAGLDEWSSRADVRGRLDEIRRLPGIGPRALQEIQDWLNEDPATRAEMPVEDPQRLSEQRSRSRRTLLGRVSTIVSPRASVCTHLVPVGRDADRAPRVGRHSSALAGTRT